jgi:hypothetical protein
MDYRSSGPDSDRGSGRGLFHLAPPRAEAHRRCGKYFSAQLEQSPFLNLLSDERISQTLALMSLAGESAQAARLASDLGTRFPQDTIVRFDTCP